MDLTKYIEMIGRQKAAKLFGVSDGAVSHWMTGKRLPSPDTARIIVDRSPVTWEGIYSPKQPRDEAVQ
jgi:DNA-binding transcriptional regulator YdaS (Cro superfamily)